MLDLKYLRNHTEKAKQQLKNKLAEVDLDALLALDEKIRSNKTEVEALKAKRNATSKEIGLKKRNQENAASLMEQMSGIGSQITELDQAIRADEETLETTLASLPNLPMDDIPVSESAEDNVCIKQWGEFPSKPFPLKNHVELGEPLGLFDLKRSAKITGSNWPLYTNKGAELEWALLNYMIKKHRAHGFTQIIPPLLVRPETMYGSGQLPKFADQLFKLEDADHPLYLIPTAEVVLGGLHMDEILEETELPKQYVSYTPCFRREAGAAGKQERGLIRTHQFNKVELFALTTPEESEAMFERMLQSIEAVLQGLGLHYRNMLLTTGDMSFAAAKTVDIEVWLPGQNRYYEVSSLSNCTDFQARRAKIRYRQKQEKPELVHTLNGSGVATSRLFVAILENFQQEDGSILLPNVLQEELGEKLTP